MRAMQRRMEADDDNDENVKLNISDQAFNLAKPGANNLTATISPFGSNLGVFGGGSPVSTSTISFTDIPGAIGLYYYSIWCLAGTNNATTQWSNFNIIQIKP
jgi:hypothetical protein